MTQQDKDLLLRDLSARLPYKVICRKEYNKIKPLGAPSIEISSLTFLDYNNLNHNGFKSFKPYLRPISSLTQEERDKFCDIGGVISHRPSDGKLYLVAYFPEALDYLNSIHADYRGLIEKGLAIEVTKENNPYK